jgi:predicted  nucleic acid-binding Zn-ribbon protein
MEQSELNNLWYEIDSLEKKKENLEEELEDHEKVKEEIKEELEEAERLIDEIAQNLKEVMNTLSQKLEKVHKNLPTSNKGGTRKNQKKIQRQSKRLH